MGHFLTLFITTYGLLHVYFIGCVWRAFPRSKPVRGGICAWCTLQIILPLIARKFDIVVLERVAFTWSVWIFWFFVLGILLDLWNLFLRLGYFLWGRIKKETLNTPPSPSLPPASLSPRAALCVCGIVILCGTVWGLIEAGSIRVETVTIRVPQFPKEKSPLRIVQISDLHLGGSTPRSRVKKVVRMIRELQPDLLVSTGDMVDGQVETLTHEARLLASLEAPLGKLAVTGNHDAYSEIDHANSFHREAGFKLLHGEDTLLLDGALRVVGVDDLTLIQTQPHFRFPHDVLPRKKSPGETVLLLAHRPTVEPETFGRFDLQLSGHTHFGQVFPFRWVVWLQYPCLAGLYEFPHGSRLYVNRGTGTWGTPLRVLAPPEITVITLENDPED
ncbi:MAG TPA: metallophosphoesterase [Candidatus Sumerlaeota bacterium]|nr:metallophosphoesterase [Candidatus Sumerlaeota bacterium]